MSAAALQQQRGKNGGGAAPRAVVPFIRASEQVWEGPFFDISHTITAAGRAFGPFEVPARGFMRHPIIEVIVTGGALDGAALTEDYPYNLLNNIQLTDPGGTPLFGPMAGYSAYLANFLGGYVFNSNVAAQPGFIGTINASYFFRIPVEVTSHDGFGSLVNENAAASYKLSFTIADTATILTGGAPVLPTVQVRGYLAAWADPLPTDPFGNPLAQEPPAHGTIQYWTEQSFAVPAGQHLVKLTRVGNPIRMLVGITRNVATGLRTTANIPNPFTINVDGRQILQLSRRVWLDSQFEAYGVALPAGVFLVQYVDDGEGHAGDEGRNLYRVTFNGTRMELGGIWGAADTLTLLTNDIAPVGAPVRPLES